jgi:hypothetical protein
MDIQQFLASGRALLTDTKQPRKLPMTSKKGAAPPPALGAPAETDPYKIFTRRAVMEKPSKADLVKDIQRFIEAAEAAS